MSGLAGVGATAGGLALAAGAYRLLPVQARTRVPRIGVLAPGPRESQAESFVDPFLDGLRALGYVEGQTITIEWRFSDYGAADRQASVEALASELARIPVDVIVTEPNSMAFAARRATRDIPIVAANTANPVETGLVDSLSRPSTGNLTALSVSTPAMGAKKVDLLRDVIPGLVQIVALVNVTTPVYDIISWDVARKSAKQAGIRIERIDLRTPDELEEAIERAASSHPDALISLQNPLLLPRRERFGALTLQHRLPVIAESREYVASGALMAWGTNIGAVSRRAAVYVDKILKGARPADLPVEQPTIFDFVVNVNTLQALGLTIPASLEPLVTEWIE